jgi:hypothetical protein
LRGAGVDPPMKTRCQGGAPGGSVVEVGRDVDEVRCGPLRRRQPSIRGRERPSFRCEAPGPTRFPGLAAHGATRSHKRDRGRAGGIEDASGRAETPRCARASLLRSSVSCSLASGSPPRPRPAWPSSTSSRAGTIPAAAPSETLQCRRRRSPTEMVGKPDARRYTIRGGRSLSTRMRHLGHGFSEEHLLPGHSNTRLQTEPAE